MIEDCKIEGRMVSYGVTASLTNNFSHVVSGTGTWSVMTGHLC